MATSGMLGRKLSSQSLSKQQFDNNDSSKLLDGEGTDMLSLSRRETALLELYDRMERNDYEMSVLRAQQSLSTDLGDPSHEMDLEGQLGEAQETFMKAKAEHSRRQRIVESVLVADPTLKAVHSGPNATPAEQKLLPFIQRRDQLSITHTNLSSDLLETHNALTTAEVENIQISARNKELADTLMTLVEKTKKRNAEDVGDARTQSQISTVEEEMMEERARWRMMKSIASAVIAGSGVDWSRDGRLRDLVLDDEDEALS
ncbi:MAG: hypothetical protein M1817_000020 [Caeruleum heppii]|nr:MAG: hypothetical protein M1817_000020 [Caeruleum heppii]